MSPKKRAKHESVSAVLDFLESETGRGEERVRRLEADTALLRRHFERVRDRLARLQLDVDTRRQRLEDA